jgi:hypothetical protein
MRRYLPEKIDIDKLINDCQESHIKNFHPDKMKWLISEIIEKPTTTSGFVEIHSKRLQSFVHNYKDYLRCLDASGVIERDMSFSHELVSKVRGYKFTDQYSSTIKGVEIEYLPIIKKIAREKVNKLKTCQGNKHLIKWFNPSLTTDYENAVDYLGTYNSELRKEQELLVEREQIISNTWYKDYSVKYLELQGCKTKNPYDSYKRAFISIDRIKEGEYHLSTDKTVSRFHSILTFMPSDFRNFLRYDGKELVCLDIKNSQAFFSLDLFKKENIEEIISVADKLNIRNGKLYYKRSNQPSTYLPSSIILEESLQRIDNQEIERYKNIVLSGRIYNYFEQALKEELGLTYPSRKALKKEFFRVLYSSNKFLGQPAAVPKRVFQKHFPGIFEYFSQLKRLHPDLIPHVLMRWESHAVLHCITKKISKDYPEVPLFTIHDGIATTRDHADLVESIICEELESLTGYAPMLKHESWNQKNLKYYDKWKHNQT